MRLLKSIKTPGYGALCASAVLVVALQVPEPANLWAMDRQAHVETKSDSRLISGLQGEAWVTPAETGAPSRALQFHDVVHPGEVVTTGPGSYIEVLVGKAVLAILHERSALRFLEGIPGTTAVHLQAGQARVAVARAGPAVTIHTPAATAVTWGGLVHVTIAAHKEQSDATRQNGESRAMPDPHRTLASGPGMPDRPETFEILEGTFQLRSWTVPVASVTVQAGQRVHVSAGRIGKPTAISTTLQKDQSLPAAALHARTSKRGVRNIAAQQQRQAEALQRAMMESWDSDTAETDGVARGAIISTTGATLPSFSQPPAPPQAVPDVVIATTGTPGSQLPSPPSAAPGRSPGGAASQGSGLLPDRLLPPGLRFDRR